MTDGTSPDHAAIRALIADYALALDARDIDGCVELFTADGEFLVYGRSFTGRDAVRQMFADSPHGLHLTGVSRIDIRGDAATARSQVLFVRAVDLRQRPALYDDELIRDGGRWLFRRRRCQFITSHGLADSPEEIS
jgi:SnoaL-like domain